MQIIGVGLHTSWLQVRNDRELVVPRPGGA